MHYASLNEKFVDEIYGVLQKHKGKKPFKVYLLDDNKNEETLSFANKKFGVNITKDLYNELDEIRNIIVKLTF